MSTKTFASISPGLWPGEPRGAVPRDQTSIVTGEKMVSQGWAQMHADKSSRIYSATDVTLVSGQSYAADHKLFSERALRLKQLSDNSILKRNKT